MKRSLVAVALAAGAALLAGGFAATAATASDDETPPAPPRPPWVNADGSMDMSKMPETLPVMGEDGKPLKDAEGRTVEVKVGDLAAIPEGGELSGGKSKSSPAEKRWTTTDEDGFTTEHVEIEPQTPTGD